MSEEIRIADANMAEIARLRKKIDEIWQACVAQENEIKRLLVELDAARAVVAQVRWAVGHHYAPPPMYDALKVYDEAMKASNK